MQSRFSTLLMMSLLVAVPALAKGKDKTLPVYILTAHTVAVIVEPTAGIDSQDPRANQVAQKDVETALLNWGRFQTVMGTVEADLIIVIRKGNGRLAEATISDPRQNDRAGVINPTDNGIGIGAQHGTQPPLSDGSQPQYPQGKTPRNQPSSQISQPELEVGGVEDSFMVFDGKVQRPLDGAPGWRYVAKDGLNPHGVPAVDEFRKAVAAAEKAAAKKP